MKMNYAAAAFALAGLCIAACNKEQMNESPVEPLSGKVELRIAAGEPRTKTTFTDPAAGDYSVKWQDSDKVGLFIAGKTSAETVKTANAKAGLTRNGDGKAYFLSEVSGYEAEDMLYAYYPYAAAEGETVSATAVKLSIPEAQTQTDGFNGSCNPMVAVPVALPAPGTAVEEPLKFRHLGAMVELKVMSSAAHIGEKVQSVSFTAKDGGKVAGEFAFDLTQVTETDAIAEYSGSSETVTVSLETPVAVSENGASVFMTVIPGSYTGVFTVTTTSAASSAEGESAANGEAATAEETHTYSYASGYDYRRASLTRYTLDLDNAKEMADEIRTVADWEAFAAAVKGGADYSGKVVSLISDITAENLPVAAGTFNGKFAGNGHTITQTANTRPLFETLGDKAEVAGLTLAGAFASFEKPYEWGNAALAKVNLGTVSNVTVNCPVNNVTVKEAMLIGALVAQNGGTLQNCKNLGDIVLKVHNPNTDKHIANLGGGLAAFGNTMGEVVASSGIYGKNAVLKPGKFIGCSNEGNISVTASAEQEKMIVGVSVYGGICGSVQADGAIFNGCTNTGDISRVSNKEASAGASTSVGGILGCCNAANYANNGDQEYVNVGGDGAGISVTITNCSNAGQLFSSCRHNGYVGKGNSGARHDNVGGIVGAVIGGDDEAKRSSIIGCHNAGIVSGGWGGNVNTTVLGGIAGLAKNVKIEGCESVGTLKNDDSHCVGAVGGFAAYVIKNVSVNGGTCTASFELKKKNDNFFWGLAFGNVKENASIDGASFGCSANIDGTDIELSETSFVDYICNQGSNVQPTGTETCTWSK